MNRSMRRLRIWGSWCSRRGGRAKLAGIGGLPLLSLGTKIGATSGTCGEKMDFPVIGSWAGLGDGSFSDRDFMRAPFTPGRRDEDRVEKSNPAGKLHGRVFAATISLLDPSRTLH